MAKKSSKATREQVYREILERSGIRFEDCNVLAFAFKQERRPELFHFGLMLHEPRPVYYLFDCFGETAQVIIPNDPENERMCIQLAESCGGSKTTPNLR